MKDIKRVRGDNFEGKAFEHYMADKFNLELSKSPTAIWDARTKDGTAVSIKTANSGNEIIFGDIFRQASVDEDFILIVGIWSKEISEIDYIHVVRITKELWASYFDKELVEKGYRKFLDKLKGDGSPEAKRHWDFARERLGSFWKARTRNIMRTRPRWRNSGAHTIECAIRTNIFEKELLKLISSRKVLYRRHEKEEGIFQEYIRYYYSSRAIKRYREERGR